MRRRFETLVLIVLLGLWGGDAAPILGAAEEEAASAVADPSVDPEDPTILRRPFTADEIRNEWVQGFSLKLLRRSPEGEVTERWTVVAADAEGVDIEYANLDADGNTVGEPVVRRNAWVELRNLGSYKADRSTREETTRATPLGELEGWLYSVSNEQTGTVIEYFFAKSLPGPPITVQIIKDGEAFMGLVQQERHRPR